MDGFGITVLYAVALLLLLADVFLPSHGMLTILSFAVLTYALYLTFQVSEQAGLLALLGTIIVVPLVLIVAVKNWHRTPMGRLISPPNPVLTDLDRLPVQQIEELIGRTGRTLTLLRPVGTAMFDGERVECCAEQGVIAANVQVEGIRLADRTLIVRAVSPDGRR